MREGLREFSVPNKFPFCRKRKPTNGRPENPYSSKFLPPDCGIFTLNEKKFEGVIFYLLKLSGLRGGFTEGVYSDFFFFFIGICPYILKFMAFKLDVFVTITMALFVCVYV